MKSVISRISSLLLLSTIIVLGTSGCYRTVSIEGNYDLITETREIDHFDEISLESFINVEYIQADYYEVQVEAESNLVPFIETTVRNHTLTVEVYDNRSLREHYRITVTIYSPNLDEFNISGSGDFYCEGLVNEDFDLNVSGSGDVAMGIDTYDLNAKISGSGNMEFWGLAPDAKFTISGSGDVRAYELEVEDCTAKITGSGNMHLWVTEKIDISISGSGDIFYMGEPTIDAKITGTGSIIHID